MSLDEIWQRMEEWERAYLEGAIRGTHEYAKNLVNFLDNSVEDVLHLNYIVYGPPGSGKTTFGKRLAELLSYIYRGETILFLHSGAGLEAALRALAKLPTADIYVIFMDDATHGPFTQRDFSLFFKIRHIIKARQQGGDVYTLFATHELGRGLAKSFRVSWNALFLKDIPLNEYERRQLRNWGADPADLQKFMAIKAKYPSLKGLTYMITPHGQARPMLADWEVCWLELTKKSELLSYRVGPEERRVEGHKLAKELFLALMPWKYRRAARVLLGA